MLRPSTTLPALIPNIRLNASSHLHTATPRLNPRPDTRHVLEHPHTLPLTTATTLTGRIVMTAA